MVAEKSKKAKPTPPDEKGAVEQIDGELVLSIEKLQEVQDELEKINEEESDKVLEVEQKYNMIRRPIYDKRTEVIQSIPDFWLTAFLSHPALSDLLTEEDHKIFKYFQSLDVTDFKDVKSGYSITLNFRSNPYFENEKLTKTIAFDDEGNTNFTGTTIKWKEGMDISNGIVKKEKDKKRPLTAESFFSWFSEEQLEGISEVFLDEVADVIKEDLWVNPLKYFNNEGDSDEEDEEDDGEENGTMNDGSTEDDSDDDEEDEEDDS